MQKDLLSLHELTGEDINRILDRSAALKQMHRQGVAHQPLKGKCLGMIFEKSSTRTRVSFEVGIYQLGGSALFLSSRDLQLGRGETIADTAQVLSRYIDGIVIRTFKQSDVEELAAVAEIPVINGLTDLLHPCQTLADLFTVKERLGSFDNLKVAYIGDGNNMANSWLYGAAKLGIELAVACPPGYEPDAGVVDKAIEDSRGTGAKIVITGDPVEAVQGARVISTDVWASMGQEGEAEKRRRDFKRYQVNADLTRHADSDYLFMHCLPAHRGEEVTAEILDGPHSIVLDEAENRLHTQKAVMELLMGEKK
ncbi:MAG: ornithine carbamoyltransferase [bacterium]|nr:ornithine carbamoyltransferase [bacterium]